jgi:hypothetical protein
MSTPLDYAEFYFDHVDKGESMKAPAEGVAAMSTPRPEAYEIAQAAANLLVQAILDLIQADPHQWSARPCQTCRSISTIAGKPFGCYEFQRIRGIK